MEEKKGERKRDKAGRAERKSPRDNVCSRELFISNYSIRKFEKRDEKDEGSKSNARNAAL